MKIRQLVPKGGHRLNYREIQTHVWACQSHIYCILVKLFKFVHASKILLASTKSMIANGVLTHQKLKQQTLHMVDEINFMSSAIG